MSKEDESKLHSLRCHDHVLQCCLQESPNATACWYEGQASWAGKVGYRGGLEERGSGVRKTGSGVRKAGSGVRKKRRGLEKRVQGSKKGLPVNGPPFFLTPHPVFLTLPCFSTPEPVSIPSLCDLCLTSCPFTPKALSLFS